MSEQDNEDITSKKDAEANENGDDNQDNADGKELTVEQLKEKNAKLFARAKKAEGFTQDSEGKWVKKPKADVPPIQQSNNSSSADPDELRLIARQFSDEEIEQAKVIAKGKGISLTEAVKDPLFLSFQKEQKEIERKEKAKLGASRGSAQGDDTNKMKPGMSDAEHKEAWKKSMGR